ncbi:hypothetical protein EDD75_0288 [Thermodesulfitimonas autotrophica]|uniref:Uncharacterized protein n=1 Tax=Thermodesulfitimonas autotrophica TaxID=1894989 RepID=A0A3N5BPC1_9THEO|nr:hypothetical protein [Thermodesulfitimonas autotrophica]RPF49472.1 hypothetical protein EDD75_0288 [Thermodesulfitimonas autotrophica]
MNNALLSKPRLAQCNDRTKRAKFHPELGEPDQWFSASFLNSRGYVGISFDFFVNWKDRSISNEIWIKRIALCDVNELNGQILLQQASLLGDNILEIVSFSQRYNLDAFYVIFEDGVDWETAAKPILKAKLESKNMALEYKSLPAIMEEIRMLSGGPLKIGRKGLFYGTSTLECYLSKTNAPWPGDVDLLLVNKDSYQVVALLEFKKHNLQDPIRNQKFENYYPNPDRRKYERLALLRDYIGDTSVPIINLYYPTSTSQEEIVLEVVRGSADELRSEAKQLLEIRGKNIKQVQQEILNVVEQLIRYKT